MSKGASLWIALRLCVFAAASMVAAPTAVSQSLPFAAREEGATPLRGLGEGAALQWPSIAVDSGTVYIAGNVFAGETLIARPAYLGRVHQSAEGDLMPLSPVDFPAGDFQFAYPRLVVSSGTLHLVWGEFDLRPRTVTAWRAPTTRVTSLWHATFEHDRWSTPERIASAYALGWNNETGGVAIDVGGAVHVAVWKGDVGSRPHVHDVAMANGRWRDVPLPYTGLNRATALTAHAGAMLVAVVDERSDTARVVLLESTDRGASWGNPRVVSSRARLQGVVARVAFSTGRRGLLLAIGEKGNDSFFLDTIRIVHVSPLGLSTRGIVPPAMVGGFEIAGTPCDVSVMLLETLSSTPQILLLAVPSGLPAQTPRPLFARARIAAFAGLSVGQPSLVAVFGYNDVVKAPWRNVALRIPVCQS